MNAETSSPYPIQHVLDILVSAAKQGGDVALRSFREGLPTTAAVTYKAGGSPVTAADYEVDAALNRVLRTAFPHSGWLSEETEDDPARLNAASLIVLDPIDGTRAFVNGDPRWAVAIALVEHGRPIAGVVHAPALGETFAAAQGLGATLNGQPLRVASCSSLVGAAVAGPRTWVADLSHQMDMKLECLPRIPSLAYRLCAVAANRATLGIARAHARDWDIAAADIILWEAGAGLFEEGKKVVYNRPSTQHAALLAAPANWLEPLTPAFQAVSSSHSG